MTTHATIRAVTERIVARSRATREAYLDRVEVAAGKGPHRTALSCSNLAHGFAACGGDDKKALRGDQAVNIAIVSAYNDMLSAHQPLATYPDIIKRAAAEVGAVAQFAGGVPAMCDGVTQGQPGMELSLFSRDVIALATGVALSHNMFDAAICLGVCDKIVPGLLIGALSFGHLPFVFMPAGPMPSGLSNKEKAQIRQQYAKGEIGRDELLSAESRAYHSPGTCTFYGTANSNQMLMELMGLHLPGTAFVNPGTPLREALTVAGTQRVAALSRLGDQLTPIAHVVDERAIVNGIVGLMATGGSTNHALHLVAIARAAGIRIDWRDLAEISAVVPLLARVYPNGTADVNHFHAAGGLAFMTRELLDAGLLHEDVITVAGRGLRAYTQNPILHDGALTWIDAPAESGDPTVVGTMAKPFSGHGGLELLEGNLGRAVLKTSAVKDEHLTVEAPAVVFHDQDDFLTAFKAGDLDRDHIAVIRFQGPRANGMPELHKLTPSLGVLQDKGFRVAIVTDGRMSGASGKVPAAIHVTPEALDGGPIARVRDGDPVRVCGRTGELCVLIDDDELNAREPATADLSASHVGMGRELFEPFRRTVSGAETGAMVVGGSA